MTQSVSPQSSAREDYLFKFLEPCHQVVKEYLHPLQRISWALQGFVWPQVTLSLKDVGEKKLGTRFPSVVALSYPYLAALSSPDGDETVDITDLTPESTPCARSMSIGDIMNPQLSWVGPDLLVRGKVPNQGESIAIYDVQTGRIKRDFRVEDLPHSPLYRSLLKTALTSDGKVACHHMEKDRSCIRLWDFFSGQMETEHFFPFDEYGAENLNVSYFFGSRYVIPKDNERVTVFDCKGKTRTVEKRPSTQTNSLGDKFLVSQDEDYALVAQLNAQGLTLFLLSPQLGIQSVLKVPVRFRGEVNMYTAPSLYLLYDVYFLVISKGHLVCYDLLQRSREGRSLLMWETVFENFAGTSVCAAVDRNYIAVIGPAGRVLVKEFEQKTPQSRVDANKKKETS